MKKIILLLTAVVFSLAITGKDYYQKGLKAYKNKNVTKAIEYFRKSCTFSRETSGAGCATLALFYEEGYKVPKSPIKAMELFEKACITGFPKGCDLAAELLNKLEKTVQCNNTNPHGCFILGKANALEGNDKKAFGLLKKGCEFNDGASCDALAMMKIKKSLAPFFTYEVPNSIYLKFSKYLKKACKLNNADGCYHLALLHIKGEKVDKNEKIKLLKKSCVLNNAEACAELCSMTKGTKFLDLCKKGCELGNSKSCRLTGIRYEHLNEKKKALFYFKKGCEIEKNFYPDGGLNCLSITLF